MGRPRVAKIKPLGRNTKTRELTLFLLFIGRIGKLLKEKGIDPAQARFLPGSLHVVAQLNPNISLTQREWDNLFDEATKWIVDNYKFVMSSYGSTMYCSRYCMRYCDFLYLQTEHIRHYFERLDPCSIEEWEQYNQAIMCGVHSGHYNTKEPSDLKDMLEPKARFEAQVGQVIYKTDSRRSKPLDPKDTDGLLYWYTFKLSKFGRQGVMRYFREQADRKSTFEIGLDRHTIRTNIGGHLYRYGHTNVRRTNRVLKNTLTRVMQDVIDEVYGNFCDYFVEQEVSFNGISLSRPVKELLVSKLKPHVFINGLTSISKVFQTLRDNINDIDAVAAVLLTAEDEKEREAGRALYEIQMELENDEEDDED